MLTSVAKYATFDSSYPQPIREAELLWSRSEGDLGSPLAVRDRKRKPAISTSGVNHQIQPELGEGQVQCTTGWWLTGSNEKQTSPTYGLN